MLGRGEERGCEEVVGEAGGIGRRRRLGVGLGAIGLTGGGWSEGNEWLGEERSK